MSQRIRSCVNHNIDTVQCESYTPKLRKPAVANPGICGGPLAKSLHTKPPRERSGSRCVPSVVSSMSPRDPAPARFRSPMMKRANSTSKSQPEQNGVILKEMYTDNPALVEVTVKTRGNNVNGGSNIRASRQNSIVRNKGEPWGKLLLQNNESTMGLFGGLSSFSIFDPLRTVHFLAQELQAKVQDNLTENDGSIRQIILDMQEALNRVPPEVASTMGLVPTSKLANAFERPVNNNINYDYPTRDDMRQERLIHVLKSNTVEKSSQTSKCRNMVSEPEKFQQHLEDSTAKIEIACRQMEVVCSKLKTDKEQLEQHLLVERDLVRSLRDQLRDKQNCASVSSEAELQQMRQDNDRLLGEVRRLQLQLQQHTPSSSQTQFLQQVQSQKTAAEDQTATLKQQLTISKMEAEKYVAILAARDKQVAEIRGEMNQLQELVMEQLREIQTAPFSSMTSCTTNTNATEPSQSWARLATSDFKPLTHTTPTPNSQIGNKTRPMGSTYKDMSNIGDTTASSSTTIELDPIIMPNRNRTDHFKTMDTQPVKQQTGENNDNTAHTYVRQDKSTIRDMFAEIKKQALLINANLPHPPARLS